MKTAEELEAFQECKKSIEEAMKELETKMPELYQHLKNSIKMDEQTGTFGYFPKE